MEKKILEKLYDVIIDRKNNPVENSYTCHLFEKGNDEILKKLGEEVVEVIVASKGLPKETLIAELADLFYHTLVLMAEQEITPEDVYQELENRFGKPGFKGKSKGKG